MQPATIKHGSNNQPQDKIVVREKRATAPEEHTIYEGNTPQRTPTLATERESDSESEKGKEKKKDVGKNGELFGSGEPYREPYW